MGVFVFIYLTLFIALCISLFFVSCMVITKFAESNKKPAVYDEESMKRMLGFLAAWEEDDNDDYYCMWI